MVYSNPTNEDCKASDLTNALGQPLSTRDPPEVCMGSLNNAHNRKSTLQQVISPAGQYFSLMYSINVFFIFEPHYDADFSKSELNFCTRSSSVYIQEITVI